MSIPKIIHHTAPTNPDNWNPIWDRCYESWKENFEEDEFEYIMWNDEDIDKLVKEKYPEYYEEYSSFPMHIIKVDFVRFCILHQYGGIYSDMDIFCYQNFFKDLKGDIILLEALAHDETVQNAFMASIPGCDFFRLCMEETINKIKNSPSLPDRFESNTKKPPNVVASEYVKDISGPYLLSEVYESCEDKTPFQLLPQKEYNPAIDQYHSTLKMKHMLTGDWGKEGKDDYTNAFMTYKEFKKLGYYQQKGIDIDLYDFKVWEIDR